MVLCITCTHVNTKTHVVPREKILLRLSDQKKWSPFTVKSLCVKSLSVWQDRGEDFVAWLWDGEARPAPYQLSCTFSHKRETWVLFGLLTCRSNYRWAVTNDGMWAPHKWSLSGVWESYPETQNKFVWERGGEPWERCELIGTGCFLEDVFTADSLDWWSLGTWCTCFLPYPTPLLRGTLAGSLYNPSIEGFLTRAH